MRQKKSSVSVYCIVNNHHTENTGGKILHVISCPTVGPVVKLLGEKASRQRLVSVELTSILHLASVVSSCRSQNTALNTQGGVVELRRLL